MSDDASGTQTSSRPVQVRYFAAAADAAGSPESTLDIPVDATVAWLRSYLVSEHGTPMAAAIENGSFLVDGVAALDDATIGRKVDVLPPFAGG